MASQLVRLGVDRLVKGKILNHTDTPVTAIYDRHNYEEEKSKAVALWSDHLRNLFANETDTKHEKTITL